MELITHGQAPQNDISSLISFLCYFQIQWSRKLPQFYSIYFTLKQTLPALERKFPVK